MALASCGLRRPTVSLHALDSRPEGSTHLLAANQVQCLLLDCGVHVSKLYQVVATVRKPRACRPCPPRHWCFRKMKCMCDRAARALDTWQHLLMAFYAGGNACTQDQLMCLHGRSGRAEQYMHCSSSGEPPCSTPAQWLSRSLLQDSTPSLSNSRPRIHLVRVMVSSPSVAAAVLP